MFFDKSRCNTSAFDIGISKEKLNQVKSQKFLGVHFDQKLMWKDHIKSVISKLNSCLGASRRARSFLNKTSLLTIYNSLMQSHVNYCLTTWGSWEPRGNKIILQRLQAACNKFFRLIYNLDRRDSVRTILKSHNVLDVFQNYDFQVGQIMQKAFNGNLPTSLCNYLIRENPLYYFINPRFKQTEKSISFAGAKAWHKLPDDYILESDFNKFKTKLKKNILNR